MPQQAEIYRLIATLHECQSNHTRTAALGISRTTLWQRLWQRLRQHELPAIVGASLDGTPDGAPVSSDDPSVDGG